MDDRERALNILLVDDDEVDVMTVRRAFQKANITNPLYVARNGVEALALLRGGAVPTSRRIVLLAKMATAPSATPVQTALATPTNGAPKRS